MRADSPGGEPGAIQVCGRGISVIYFRVSAMPANVRVWLYWENDYGVTLDQVKWVMQTWDIRQEHGPGDRQPTCQWGTKCYQ